MGPFLRPSADGIRPWGVAYAWRHLVGGAVGGLLLAVTTIPIGAGLRQVTPKGVLLGVAIAAACAGVAAETLRVQVPAGMLGRRGQVPLQWAFPDPVRAHFSWGVMLGAGVLTHASTTLLGTLIALLLVVSVPMAVVGAMSYGLARSFSSVVSGRVMDPKVILLYARAARPLATMSAVLLVAGLVSEVGLP